MCSLPYLKCEGTAQNELHIFTFQLHLPSSELHLFALYRKLSTITAIYAMLNHTEFPVPVHRDSHLSSKNHASAIILQNRRL